MNFRAKSVMALAAIWAAAVNGQQPSNPKQGSAEDAGSGRAWASAPKIVISEPQQNQQKFDAANAERRKQIADDSAKLLKMAADLKMEVDKTTQDTLSLSVIRQADAIEKLARNVKEKMKLIAASE